MELKLDNRKTYAVALEGGGAKGAYQIGAWQAMDEAGIKYNAVSGTSVGALNGTLMTMRDIEEAKKIWLNICFSKVIDVDDDFMRKLFSGKLSELDIKTAAGSAKKIIANKGFDIAPLYKMLGEVADETKIRASDVDFYIITFSLTDRRELELRAKDLPAGEIKDMLLASAYLPAFRNEKLGGKRYTDGGVRDALPLHVLIENGYKNIIAVRLNGNGIMRHVRIPDDATIYTVKPTEDLGSVLNFNSEQSRRNMTIGYYDMKRLLYGLSGRKYYIDRTLTETSAYEFITDYIFGFLKDAGLQSTWYNINNAVIPEIEMRLRVKGDYYDIMIAILEETALEAGLERYKIYTDNEFISVISGFYSLFKDKYPRFIKKIVNEAIDNQ